VSATSIDDDAKVTRAGLHKTVDGSRRPVEWTGAGELVGHLAWA
jgi:hypothetical protein